MASEDEKAKKREEERKWAESSVKRGVVKMRATADIFNRELRRALKGRQRENRGEGNEEGVAFGCCEGRCVCEELPFLAERGDFAGCI